MTKTEIKKPNIVEIFLTLVLVIWIVMIGALIRIVIQNVDLAWGGFITLGAFFMMFISIMLIVVAILLEGIRKELKELR